MEGLKQCPECQSADVPASAEICPFCGYSFGKQPASKPVEKKTEKPRDAEGPLNLSDDLPFNRLGYGNIPDEQPKKTESVTVVDQVQNQGNTAPVSGGNTVPSSTEYKTYKKKGKKAQTDANASGQGQGGKAVMFSLLTVLAIAALCMDFLYSYIEVMRTMRWTDWAWCLVLNGVIAASMHRCCFDNEKGSRKAGILGIIVGYGLFFIRVNGAIGYSIYSIILGGEPMLVLIVAYAVCWFISAKLVRNSKTTKTFLLTAVVMLLAPVLLGRLLTGWRRPNSVIGFYGNLIGTGRVGIYAIAMIAAVILLCVQKWLASKPRKLFWVLYTVILIGALLYMRRAINIGLIRFW